MTEIIINTAQNVAINFKPASVHTNRYKRF